MNEIEENFENWRNQIISGERHRETHLQLLRKLLAEAPHSEGNNPPKSKESFEFLKRKTVSLVKFHQSKESLLEKCHELHQMKSKIARLRASLHAQQSIGLEQETELKLLEQQRTLDKHRLAQLLRAIDPKSIREIGKDKEPRVSMTRIRELESNVQQTEKESDQRTKIMCKAISALVDERAKFELNQHSTVNPNFEELKCTLKEVHDKERVYGKTILEMLEIRQCALVTQRICAELRHEALQVSTQEKSESENYHKKIIDMKKTLHKQIEMAKPALVQSLKQRIVEIENETYVMEEQELEMQRIFEQRRESLQKKLREATMKHAELKKRCTLETEGYKRDFDELSRRFAKIRNLPVTVPREEEHYVMSEAEQVDRILHHARQSFSERFNSMETPLSDIAEGNEESEITSESLM